MNNKVRNNWVKLFVVLLLVSVIVFTWKYYDGVEKTVEGQLVSVKIFSRFDGGHDTVIVFNVSGENKYVVINEWRTGQVVELASHETEDVRVFYMFREWQDRNVLMGYEMI